jgi:NADH-quinone oxidoreductase subunit F
MDLDVMADVQHNIIGNCLCLLGDSMAMPVGSMIKYFRPEFEAHIEEAIRRQSAVGRPPISVSDQVGLAVPATGEVA